MTRDAKRHCRPGGRTTAALLLSVQLLAPLSGLAQSGRAKTDAVRKIEDLLSRTNVHIPPQSALAVSARSIEVRLQWNAYLNPDASIVRSEAQGRPAGGFVIIGIQQVPEAVVQPRAPELSTEELLIAAVDAQQGLRAWTLVLDPRILREESRETKDIKGEIFHHTRPEFVITLPEDNSIAELRIYSPTWSEGSLASH
jgi:hypothetical protein